MSQFFAYEEYGAKYQLMLQDSASANKTIPLWKTYERGIEALANSLASINSYNAHSQKGLAFGDLLIKVIQAFVLLLDKSNEVAYPTCLQVSYLVRRPL